MADLLPDCKTLVFLLADSEKISRAALRAARFKNKQLQKQKQKG